MQVSELAWRSQQAMARDRIEIALLRKSVGDLEAGRHRCCHCHRTPLVGEEVHHYGERLVCQLCRHLRREAPGRSEVMHSPEHQRAVRLLRPRAA
jgi:hypothetical protein